MKRDPGAKMQPAATWSRTADCLARGGGAAMPLLAVLALGTLLALMSALVDLDGAAVPKPAFRTLLLPGYPAATQLADAALVAKATLWWLCLSSCGWPAWR